MRILLFNQTAHIFSGSGAVVNNLKNVFPAEDILVLTEECHEDSSKLIDAKVIMDQPNLPSKGTRFFYWLYWFKISRALKNALKKAEEYKPDVILAVFPNEYFLYLGYLLAKEMKLPFIPWFHNTYAENRNGLERIIGKYIQGEIFESSSMVLTISDGLTDYYKKAYPKHHSKFETLQHGFKINYATLELPKQASNKIKFAFTGSLNSSCKEAAHRLFQVIGNNKEYELHIFSGSPKQVFEKIMPKKAHFIYHGFVPEEEFEVAIRSCDICLVAHGFTGDIHPVEYQTIFPTRTIPLLSMRVPILFHTPEYAAFTKFIEKNDCGFLVKEADEMEIQDTINEILSNPNIVKQKIDNALRTAEYFNIKKTTQKLNNLIHQVTSSKEKESCVE